MSLKVEDVMVKDVIAVVAKATVREAAEVMNKHDIGCLVVTNRGKPVGIVTERDMLKRVLTKSIDPAKTKVSKIMSKPLIVGGSRMDLEDAARLMFSKKIKKLPIVEEGRLIGLVTLTDIAVATTTERTQLKKILSEFPHLKKRTRNKTNFLLKLFQPAE